MTRVLQIVLYLGVGMFCHAIALGIRFDPHDPWSWVLVLGGPVGLAFLAVVAIGIALIAVTLALLLLDAGR